MPGWRMNGAAPAAARKRRRGMRVGEAMARSFKGRM